MFNRLTEDIPFARKCGFQTLLVLTGVTKEEDLKRFQYSDQDKPDYFIKDLHTLNEILKGLRL